MAGTLDVLGASRLSFYDNVPAAFIIQGTAQSIPNNVDTAITFNFAVTDNWVGWSSGSSTRYTVQVAGTYLIGGAVAWAGNATGRRFNYLRVNGSTNVPGSGGNLDSPATNGIIVTCATVTRAFVVGDYLELMANQNSGAALNTSGTGLANASVPNLFAVWLHN